MTVVAGSWCITPGQLLVARGWDDEFVLYNNLSGDTHLVDADSLFLLDCLRAGPATIDALVTALQDSVLPEDLPTLPDTITTVLTDLAQLFLVEPC